MNDLVSEYQQYQDATAEGKKYLIKNRIVCMLIRSSLSFSEEGEDAEGEAEDA